MRSPIDELSAGVVDVWVGTLTYFHPKVLWQTAQYMSRTVCFPVRMSRSSGSAEQYVLTLEVSELSLQLWDQDQRRR